MKDDTCWTVKTVRSFYPGTYGVGPDSYIRDHIDCIVAVPTKAEAERIAEALNPTNYVLSYGEYAAPHHEPRRIRADKSRVRVLTEAEACQTLGLDYDLEAANA